MSLKMHSHQSGRRRGTRQGLFALLTALVLLAPHRAAPWTPPPEWDTRELWLTGSMKFTPTREIRGPTVILLHGFGGSPYDMKPLAEVLAADGFRLLIPLIPGEGKSLSLEERDRPEAEEIISWIGELAEAEQSRSGCEPLLVGFSMGGTLATIAASKGQGALLVLVSPFFSLPRGDDAAGKAAAILSPLIPALPKPWKGRIRDKEGYGHYEPGTRLVPLKSYIRLRELAQRGRESVSGLPPIPVLVLASPDDRVASFEETAKLFAPRPSTQVDVLDGSDHIIFYDSRSKEAVERVRTFLGEASACSQGKAGR